MFCFVLVCFVLFCFALRCFRLSSPLHKLAPELLLNIIRFLGPVSIRALGCTCVRFKAVVQSMHPQTLPYLRLRMLQSTQSRALLRHQQASVHWMIKREAGMSSNDVRYCNPLPHQSSVNSRTPDINRVLTPPTPHTHPPLHTHMRAHTHAHTT